jgi:hypothetical protein
LVLWILTRIALALFSRISAKKKVKQTWNSSQQACVIRILIEK